MEEQFDKGLEPTLNFKMNSVIKVEDQVTTNTSSGEMTTDVTNDSKGSTHLNVI